MNWNFIHPGLLYGFLACAIPIIIHLIFRRRYQRIHWAAMKFLLAAYKHTKTSLLLENLLLLLLRILVIFLLVLIFARPIAREMPLLSTTQIKESFLLILDNSYSMGVRTSNFSPFENAKKQARAIIEKANRNDTISLIVMNDLSQQVLSFVPLSSDKKRYEILQQIEEIELSEMGTDIEAAIDMLKSMAEQKEYQNKHIYILSDFQKNVWQNACQKSSFVETIKAIRSQVNSFQLLDSSVPNAQNLGIVKIQSDGVVSLGERSRFIATIRNYGSKSYNDVGVHLYVNGQKQKTEYVSLSAQQEAEVSFLPSFVNQGSHYVTIELDPDELATDNKRHISFDVVPDIKVLVIDGEPKDEAFESESDYLMAALGYSPQGLIKANKINIGDLSPTVRFKDFDVVFLANLQSFDNDNRFLELETFLNKGGGVFISLGGKVPHEYYNLELYKPGKEILPGEIASSPIGNTLEKEKTLFSLDEIQNHRAWKFFYENRRLMEDLKQCFTFKFFPVKIDPKDDSVRILAKYNSPGAYPALVERKFGRGKLILFTSTLDREWNNFHTDQFGHVFVVLMHEFLQYLVSRPEENNLAIRHPIAKSYDFFIQNAQMVLPKGESIKLEIQSLDKGGYHKIFYKDTYSSGVYTLDMAVPPQIQEEKQNIRTKEYFSINVAPEEGDINYMSKEELLSYFKDSDLKYEKNIETKSKSESGKKDVEYWRQILVLLGLLTLAETFFAMMFGKFN